MDGFAGWLGIVVDTDAEVADGAGLHLDVDERHLNPAGTVHGGVLATLVDTAMGQAVRAVSDTDTPATSQLSLVFVRPATTGRLTVTARVQKEGRHLLVCDAEVEQDGRRVLQALATFAAVRR